MTTVTRRATVCASTDSESLTFLLEGGVDPLLTPSFPSPEPRGASGAHPNPQPPPFRGHRANPNPGPRGAVHTCTLSVTVSVWPH